MDHQRLSALVLEALELAIEQKDKDLSSALANVLELAMTRNAGGAGFTERREYPERVEKALDHLSTL